jgi:hypothetical protein
MHFHSLSEPLSEWKRIFFLPLIGFNKGLTNLRKWQVEQNKYSKSKTLNNVYNQDGDWKLNKSLKFPKRIFFNEIIGQPLSLLHKGFLEWAFSHKVTCLKFCQCVFAWVHTVFYQELWWKITRNYKAEKREIIENFHKNKRQ